ncbi:MAG: mechanosensitive ion channel family protein [Myxococcales bacterium]|jgi:small conductance mechanosensitive channel
MPDFETLTQTLLDTIHQWVQDAISMLPNALGALLVLVVARYGSRWLERLVVNLVDRVSENRPFAALLGTLSRFAALGVGFFVALGMLNLDKTVTSLLAGVGVVGLALGFAFQDIAANFMSGFIMALRRPFEPGDLVEVAGRRGRIMHIAMRATELETLDGLSITIPNKEVFQGVIVNYTRTSIRRVDVQVGTAYCDDMETVREVVLSAVREVPHRDATHDPELFFESFGDSSINFVVRVWLGQADELTYLAARSEAMIAIKKALDARQLTIPFPIRTLDFGAAPVGGTALQSTTLRVASGS